VTDAPSGEPASEATAGLIDRAYEAINARDADALALISVPGFEWRDPDGMPGGGVHRGAQEVIARIRELDESMDELWFTAEEIVGAGDRVLVRTHVSGRGRESGVPAQLDLFALFRIDGGRIAAQAAFFDRPKAEEALRGT
jgi:ketosteroid isomerase-like protein